MCDPLLIIKIQCMRKRKTNETKDECMEEITGKSHKKKAEILLYELKNKKTKKTIFISSKKLFPNRKELLIEVDILTSNQRRDEIITRRMTAKMIE